MNSVPLIQKVDKDSINTTIIALKKAINEIESVLGLDSGSEIDTSVFVKKSEVVDAVEADNLNPVTSNAVAEYTVDRIEVSESRPASSNAVAEAINVIPYNKFRTLPSGANMNDCIDPAIIYYNSSTLDCNSFINRPTFTGGGEMAVFNLPLGSANYTIQFYIAKDGTNRSIAHRVFNGGNWSSWDLL